MCFVNVYIYVCATISFGFGGGVAKHIILKHFSVFRLIIATLEIMFEVNQLFEFHSNTLNINTFIVYKCYHVLCFLCQS